MTASIALLLLVGLSLSANAQKRLKFSSTEDIALAFYKTGGIIPNFEHWIKERKPYNLTPWGRREKMLATEMSRLQLAYKNFTPKDDFLLIRTFVHITPEEHVNDNGEKTYSLSIVFSKAPDALYFPYNFLDQRIVLMPYKLETIMNSEINETQYNFIQETTQASHKNTMVVRLRAKEADFSKPYEIDGLEQWVFKTKIASLEIWNKQNRLLWEYTAPWYISPNLSKLNKLFDGRPSSSSERGGVKALFSNSRD